MAAHLWPVLDLLVLVAANDAVDQMLETPCVAIGATSCLQAKNASQVSASLCGLEIIDVVENDLDWSNSMSDKLISELNQATEPV